MKTIQSCAKSTGSSRYSLDSARLINGVMVTSKESLKADGPQRLVLLWQKSRLRDLNVSFLKDLKKAAEALNGRKN